MGLKESGLRGSLRSVSTGVIAIPDSVVDNFEDADSDPAGIYEEGDTLSDFYTFRDSTDDASRVSDSNIIDGSFALEFDSPSATNLSSNPGDGLNRYISKGDRFSALVRSVDEEVGIIWGVGSTSDDRYQLAVGQNNNDLRLSKSTDGNFQDLSTPNVSIESGEWYELEIEWHDGSGSESDNTIISRVFDVDQSTGERGPELQSTSVSDSDHADNEGVGFTIGGGATGDRVDRYQFEAEVD